jgi:hypothetical protein
VLFSIVINGEKVLKRRLAHAALREVWRMMDGPTPPPSWPMTRDGPRPQASMHVEIRSRALAA